MERNVLTVKAEPKPSTGEGIEALVTERPTGMFSRQLFLGETLDTEHIDAGYDAGVLTLRIPVADHAKPRKIQISAGDQAKQITGRSAPAPRGRSALGAGPRLPSPEQKPREQQTLCSTNHRSAGQCQ
jgi:hypothetical protein